MILTKSDLQSLVAAELNNYNTRNLDLDLSKAQNALQVNIQAELKDLNCESTKKARLDYFKIKGASKNDYTERRLNLSKKNYVIYGIRHLGGNSEFPFIHLRANFNDFTKKEAIEVYELIKDEFKVFKPLYLSFQAPKMLDADFFGSVHMVAKINNINCQLQTNEDSISFESITNNSYYDWYRQGYDEFHLNSPELKTKVLVNSVSLMQESLDQELLKFVKLNGERIGIISAQKDLLLGHSAVYFNEIFLSKNWRGKGLASNVQRKFLQDFCQEVDYVWGTIDYFNQASYRTAYSNGRRPIAYECFINLY